MRLLEWFHSQSPKIGLFSCLKFYFFNCLGNSCACTRMVLFYPLLLPCVWPLPTRNHPKKPPLILLKGNGCMGRNEKIEVGRTDNLIERGRKKIFGWFHQISWRRRRRGNYVGGGGIRRNFHLLLAVDPFRPHSEMEGRRKREENMFFSPPLCSLPTPSFPIVVRHLPQKRKKYCDIVFLKKYLFAIRKPKNA